MGGGKLLEVGFFPFPDPLLLSEAENVENFRYDRIFSASPVRMVTDSDSDQDEDHQVRICAFVSAFKPIVC